MQDSLKVIKTIKYEVKWKQENFGMYICIMVLLVIVSMTIWGK